MSRSSGFLSNISRPALAFVVLLLIGSIVAAVSMLVSWMIGAVVLGGFAALGLMLLSLHFVNQFASRRWAEGFSQDLLKDIGRKFDSGIDTFKANDKSIYSLPWYLMVGEPGAGKTEAIRHSSIGFPNGLNKPAQGRGGTVNMDWWFAKKAILLDTAGRLMFEATDEWRSFLKLLRRHRPQTPINGMILAIPAPSLLTDTAEQIAEKAGQISQQFDAVQRELGVRFPVYVLITKADKIAGFREYFHNLQDPTAQNQMLGWSNPANLDDPFEPELVDAHLETVRQRLQRRKLSIMLDPRPLEEGSKSRIEQVDALYAFPSELMRISSRLRMYLETIFMPNEWADKPLFLRGIYFTSAMSEGAALDMDLADAFGINPNELPVEMRIFGKEKSYFLRDFFLDKCFPEGGLVTRAKNVKREISTRRLTVFATAALAACALIAATLYGQIALQKSVSRPARFWAVMSQQQARQTIPVSTTMPWFSMIDPITGEYLGDHPLPTELGGSVAGLFNEVQRQDAIRVPIIFRPWDRATTGLDSMRREARRNLFDLGVLRPVVSAARAKLTNNADTLQLDPAVVDASGQLLRLSSPADRNQFDTRPLFGLLYPGTVPAPLEQMPIDKTSALYTSDNLSWPPTDLLTAHDDTAAVLQRKLLGSADTVASGFDRLATVVEQLSTTHKCEMQLLKVSWNENQDTFDISTRDWNEMLSMFDRAKKESDAAQLAADIAPNHQNTETSLTDRLTRLRTDQQTVESIFQSLAAQSNSTEIRSAQEKSTSLLAGSESRLRQAIGLSSADGASNEQKLSWFDACYANGDVDQRFNAYKVASGLFGLPSAAANTAASTQANWQWFADAMKSLSVQSPEVAGASPMDVLAKADISRLAQAADQNRRAVLTQQTLASMPHSADDWARLVKDAAGKQVPQQIAPLPLTTDQPVSIDPRFSSRAAASLIASWSHFLTDWKRLASPSANQDQQLESATSSLQSYVKSFCEYWSSVQNDPTIAVGDWPSARNQLLSTGFDLQLGDAIVSLCVTRNQALDVLSNACSFDPQSKRIIDLARSAITQKAASDEFAKYVAETWKNIAGGSDISDQTRRLLAVDQVRLFPASLRPDDVQSRYWKRMSVALLLSIETPAKSASNATLDRVKQQLDAYPVSYPGNGTTLTVEQVKKLRDDISGLVAARSGPGPNTAGVDQAAADCLRRIGLGNQADLDSALQHKAATLELLSRDFSASLNILPDKQQAELNHANAIAFSHATFVCKVGDQNVTDPQTADWPVDLVTDVGHCDFPKDQLNASINFTGNQKATCDFAGGAWWPFVALQNGSAKPTGQKNHWYVRVPVILNGNQKAGEWMDLEIHQLHSSEQIMLPWPVSSTPGPTP